MAISETQSMESIVNEQVAKYKQFMETGKKKWEMSPEDAFQALYDILTQNGKDRFRKTNYLARILFPEYIDKGITNIGENVFLEHIDKLPEQELVTVLSFPHKLDLDTSGWKMNLQKLIRIDNGINDIKSSVYKKIIYHILELKDPAECYIDFDMRNLQEPEGNEE